MKSKFSNEDNKRVIRISVTDNYATDSSSDEDDDHNRENNSNAKKVVNEIRIQKCSDLLMNASSSSKQRTNKQCKNNKSGKTRPDPTNVIKYRGVRLRGSDAMTNILKPPDKNDLGSIEESDEIWMTTTATTKNLLSSPTSVLRFQSVEEVKTESREEEERGVYGGDGGEQVYFEDDTNNNGNWLFLDSSFVSRYSDFDIPLPMFFDEIIVPEFVSNDNFGDIPLTIDQDFKSIIWDDVESYF